MKKEKIGTIDYNYLQSKRRVLLDNNTVTHKDKKKEKSKKKCRKGVYKD